MRELMDIILAVALLGLLLLLAALVFHHVWSESRRRSEAKKTARFAKNAGDEIATVAEQPRNNVSGSRCENGSACTGGVVTPPYSGVGQNAVSKLDTGIAGIDLSGKRRETFALVLPDGKTLHVYTPTKVVADLFADIGTLLQRSAKGRATPENSEELFRLSALVLGNNAERVRVDAQALFTELTLDDVVELLTAYMQWLTDLIERKN